MNIEYVTPPAGYDTMILNDGKNLDPQKRYLMADRSSGRLRLGQGPVIGNEYL